MRAIPDFGRRFAQAIATGPPIIATSCARRYAEDPQYGKEFSQRPQMESRPFDRSTKMPDNARKRHRHATDADYSRTVPRGASWSTRTCRPAEDQVRDDPEDYDAMLAPAEWVWRDLQDGRPQAQYRS